MCNLVSKLRIPPTTSLKTFTPEIEIDNVVCTVTTKQGTGSVFSTSGDIVENKKILVDLFPKKVKEQLTRLTLFKASSPCVSSTISLARHLNSISTVPKTIQ